MGVQQVASSFQNDGNFSQLDLRDIAREGPILRIETFRCSQPESEYGTTAAGTPATAIAGGDHLQESSNRTFRHIFSTGDPSSPTAVLEIREIFGEDGSMEVRTRDIDNQSGSFGAVLVNSISPAESTIAVRYEIRRPNIRPVHIASPLSSAVSAQVEGLVDLASEIDALGDSEQFGGKSYCELTLEPKGNNSESLAELDEFASQVRESHPTWTKNVKVYERMGDFRDKCVHPGTNFTGNRIALASEFSLIRAYRTSLITLGRIFDDEMSTGGSTIAPKDALSIDTKPGVYSVFLSAYALNIGLYQLGLDKVHSDYGGIPMQLRPGSRLENQAAPIVDSTNLNRMLALVASLYYLPSATSQVTDIRPTILDIAGRTTSADYFAS